MHVHILVLQMDFSVPVIKMIKKKHRTPKQSGATNWIFLLFELFCAHDNLNKAFLLLCIKFGVRVCACPRTKQAVNFKNSRPYVYLNSCEFQVYKCEPARCVSVSAKKSKNR